MAKVKIQGNASGTGVLTVTAPNTSTDRTITLPDSTGTLATTADVPSSITDNGDATAITIDSSERVGIGTGSPTSRLHVYNANDHVRLSVQCAQNTGQHWQFQSRNNGEFWIRNDTTGSNKLIMDATGAVTMPSQPCASFGWSSDISANSVIPANLIRVNTGSHLNSSGRFTAPVAGTYWYGYVGMSHNNTNNFKVELLKNGSLNGNDTRAFTHDVAYSQNSIFGFITLSANDYLEFKPQNVTLHSNYGQISIKLVA